MAKHSRRQLVFWYGVADPYMVDRFTALAESGRVDFECWYNDLKWSTRSWDISTNDLRFPHVFLPRIKVRHQPVGVPFRRWSQVRPEILVSFHGSPAVSLSKIQSFRTEAKLVYYVEKTFDTWVKRNALKEGAKRILMGTADAFLTPGDDADSYVRRYSAAPIFRLNHAVQYQHFAQSMKLRHSPEFEKKRRGLGLDGYVFLNVGRMWNQKGIETLIDAFTHVERRGIDASLLLVGDGVDKDRYKALVAQRGLRRVRFMDFVQQAEIPRIYALADAFVFPTRGDPYGLVVDEAMSSGLPVIATETAGEIRSRVLPGMTGDLVPVDDSGAMVNAMIRMLEDPLQSRQMGANGSARLSERDLANWVSQIESAVGDISNGSRARRLFT